MDRTVADGIDLDLTRDNSRLLASDIQHVERRQERALLDLALEIALTDLDVLRRSFAAVNHGRDQTLLARLKGRAFARARAGLGDDVLDLAHGDCPPGLSP